MTGHDIGGVRERLKAHVGSDNFVYAVGYALERTHSGTLAQLLRDDELGPKIVARLWNHSHDDADCLLPEDVESVQVEREKKLGNGCVPDLVIEFNVRGVCCWLILEYKVDGTSGHEAQCRRIEEAAIEKGLEPCRFLFVTVGGGEFFDGPKCWDNPPVCFSHLCLKELLALLPESDCSNRLLPDYREALEDEGLRRLHVHLFHDLTPDTRKEYGYRRFDWWYAMYHRIRCAMPEARRREWSIWSGTNNAVMNWWPAFAGTRKTMGGIPHIGRIYVELRDAHLIGCIEWREEAEGNAELPRLIWDAAKRVCERLERWKPVRPRVPQKYGSWGKSPALNFDDHLGAYLLDFVDNKLPRICESMMRWTLERNRA